MRKVLINEICNEKPNAAAFGAFSKSISYINGRNFNKIIKATNKTQTEFYTKDFSKRISAGGYGISVKSGNGKVKIGSITKSEKTNTQIRNELNSLINK